MKVGLFGCGAYGMALSSIMIDNHCDITMWTKFEDEKKNLEETRKNEKLIPNFRISDKIKITTNVEECIKGKDLLIIAIPAAFIDSLAISMKPFIKDNHIVVATKGIEQETGLFIHQILEKYLGLDITLIPCAGGDEVASQREQWNDGSNTLAIAPGVVVVYNRNTETNRVLREYGLKVIEMSSAELSRGRGGPRCMSMPLVREK